jgi:predicted ribosomally synthesized peptide with SipW-like signal peptide
MKRILLSLMVIALASATAIGATRAYFSDTESSAGNTFASGKLDLVLGEGNPLPFSVSDLAPGDTGTGKVTLTNTDGSLDGDLDVKITNFLQDENGCIEPEISAGDPCDAGDLDLGFKIAMYLDVNQNGIFDAGDYQLAYNGQKSAYPGFWGGDFHFHPVSSNLVGWDDILIMTDNQSVDLIVNWQLPATWDYPKTQAVLMTDSLSFDLMTSLEQVGGNGGVTE